MWYIDGGLWVGTTNWQLQLQRNDWNPPKLANIYVEYFNTWGRSGGRQNLTGDENACPKPSPFHNVCVCTIWLNGTTYSYYLLSKCKRSATKIKLRIKKSHRMTMFFYIEIKANNTSLGISLEEQNKLWWLETSTCHQCWSTYDNDEKQKYKITKQ